jgi:hypothetical protein
MRASTHRRSICGAENADEIVAIRRAFTPNELRFISTPACNGRASAIRLDAPRRNGRTGRGRFGNIRHLDLASRTDGAMRIPPPVESFGTANA